MKKCVLFFLLVLCFFEFLGCTSKTSNISSIKDLEGKIIGIQSGTTSETLIRENLQNAMIREFKTGVEATVALNRKEIDAIIIDELPAKSITVRNDNFKIVRDKFLEEEYAIAVKKGNKKLLDSINKTLEKMKKDGTFKLLSNAFISVEGNITLPNIDEIETEEYLRVGTNAAFPPFEYIENGKIIGFDISLAEYIAKDYGKRIHIVDKAFDTLIPALMSGSIDFIVAGMSITEDRKQVVDFSEPYYKSTQVIIVRQ